MIGVDAHPVFARPRQGRAAGTAAALAHAPLTDSERAWAAGVGRRLRAEFGALVGALPAHQRSAAGLERVLGTNRAVAHRLFSALGEQDDLEMLTRIPGVEGLRKTTAAAKKKFGRPASAIITGTESALAEFQELIRSTGGSHARLVARLRASATAAAQPADPAGTPPGRREETRLAMFRAVQALCGRSVEVRASISIVRPRPDNPLEAEYVHARAFIGYRAVPGALPLVLSSWVTNMNESPMLDADYRDLRNAPIGGLERPGLLEPFCSNPLPLVSSRDTSGRLVQIVDRSRTGPGAPIDAVTAYRLPSVGPIASRLDPPIFLEAVTATSPTERLVADFYFHRSLTVGCTPALNLYLGRGTGGCDLLDRWHEQVSGGPLLGLLGTGIANAHTATWSRHAELTRHVFGELGWDPADYVGFRCEERWPLWYCDYVMSLDYRETNASLNPPAHQ